MQGVTGSIPGARGDIDRILEIKKKECPDLKLVLVPDSTRFTRAGPLHGASLLFDLRSVGIIIYLVAEGLIVDNDLAYQLALTMFSAAHSTAKAIARGSTLGYTVSFLSGRSAYTQRPPIGLDRLYWVDGKPIHIIRNLPDGRQLMLDAATRDVLRVFDANTDEKPNCHYRKQQNESISLIPGDESEIAKVVLVMELFHIQKLSPHMIAKRLNDAGILSPLLIKWTSVTVTSILRRPAYVGLGIRGRTRGGIYYNMGDPEPVPSGVDLSELIHRKNVRVHRQPRERWKERPIPELENFLPESVRVLARRYIEDYLNKIGDPSYKPPRKRGGDRHGQSTFFLKGIITSEPGGYRMTGRIGGSTPGKPVRSYAVSAAYTNPETHCPVRGLINAEAVESAVLEHLLAVLRERPNVEAAIAKAVRSAIKKSNSAPDLKQLDREIRQLRRQIAALADHIGGEEDEVEAAVNDNPIVSKMQALQGKLNRKLAERRAAGVSIDCTKDADALAASVARQLEDFAQTGQAEDMATLRGLVQTFVTKLVANPKTKEVHMEVAVPSWFVRELLAPHATGKVVLAERSGSRMFNQTHLGNGEQGHENEEQEPAVPLASFDCQRLKRDWKVCYVCSRSERKRAA